MRSLLRVAWCILLCLSVTAGVASASLKIGVLLIEDSVPLYVAEQEKLFAREQVDVELVPFLSALERDSALLAGAIDGAVSDPVGAILLDKGRNIIRITSLCLGKTPEEGVFAIVASPQSDIASVDDLKKIPIAVSNATIIEYVTERMLEAKGLRSDEIETIEVKKMPIRMQMLLANTVPAATLPEPLASIAVSKGARVILSDKEQQSSLSQTVMIFRRDALQGRQKEVSSFFRALTSAVAALNENPEHFRKLFIEKSRIPPFLADTYVIPTYPAPTPFPKSLYQPVMDWLSSKDLSPELAYEYMVATELFYEQP